MHSKKLFSEDGLQQLAEAIGQRNCLIGFDYDGTLAPMNPDPNRAIMRKTTERYLVDVCRKFDCALVTGRSIKDIAKHTRQVPFRFRIGNHGIETPKGVGRFAVVVPKVKRWKELLEPLVEELPGVFIEDKKYSLSVHYQYADHPLRAYRTIMERSAKLKGAASVPGKNVVNVVARNVPNKGTAFAAIMKTKGYSNAIFIGDDITDENVFRIKAVGKKPILSIRIGDLKGTHADLIFQTQREIDSLLKIISKS